MPEPVKVWLVPLGRNNQEEVPGRLSLEPGALLFDVDGGGVETLPLNQIKKVGRVHGSPILMVTHLAEGEVLRTAFYFSKPPPVPSRRSATATADRGRPLRRSGKRREQRANASYLTSANTTKKELVVEWTIEVRRAVRDANG